MRQWGFEQIKIVQWRPDGLTVVMVSNNMICIHIVGYRTSFMTHHHLSIPVMILPNTLARNKNHKRTSSHIEPCITLYHITNTT